VTNVGPTEALLLHAGGTRGTPPQ